MAVLFVAYASAGATTSIHRPDEKVVSARPSLSAEEKIQFQKELEAGNGLFSKFEVEKALPHFVKAHDLDPDNYEAHLKLLRINNALGQHALDLEDDHDKAESYFRRNISIAENLAEKNPKNAEALFAKAVAYGNLALYSPAKEKVRLAQNIEKDLKASIRLDPQYPYAYLGLAIFYREVSQITFMERFFANLLFGEIPRASLDDAEKYFKIAIEKDPNFIFARYHYGKSLEYAGRLEDAVKQYELALSLPKKDFNDDILKQKSKEAIEELKPGYFQTHQNAERTVD